MKYENSEKNIKILAKEINIGKSVEFGKDISITVKGKFEIGNYSRLGDNTEIRGNNIIFGEDADKPEGLIR